MKRKKQSFFKRIFTRVSRDNEIGAKRAVLEDLFNDFHSSRAQVYRFNFIRGIFFGLGSVLGGTVVIAVIVWLLNFTGQLIPGIAGFIDEIIRMMQIRR